MNSESTPPRNTFFLPCAVAILLALLGVFLGMCCIGGLLGESFTYVEGFVVDEAGDAIGNAFVSLEVIRLQRSVDKDTTKTDSDGGFIVGTTTGGFVLGTPTVVLTVEKDDYERNIQEVPYGKYSSGQRITLRKSAPPGDEDRQRAPR